MRWRIAGRCQRPRLAVLGAMTCMLATLGSAAEPQGPTKPAAAASIFKSQCATCHGADGAGTTLGKSLQAPDLRSARIQRQPASALGQVVREGKGNMPAFGRGLDEAQNLPDSST